MKAYLTSLYISTAHRIFLKLSRHSYATRYFKSNLKTLFHHHGPSAGMFLKNLSYHQCCSTYTPETYQFLKALLYADETAILTKSLKQEIVTRTLNAAANELGEWCRRARGLNGSKSNSVLLTRNNHKPHGTVTLKVENVPWIDNVKYFCGKKRSVPTPLKKIMSKHNK